MLDWITSFLTCRKQRVKIGHCLSNESDVSSGVPQGSVLGPLLFLLFINDIVYMFGDNLKVKLFADDVKIYIEVNDIADNLMLQRGLDNLKRWCIKWQLNISIEKCAVLHLGSYNKTFNNYNIDTVQLPNTCEVKDLGVTVDSMLTFKSHINNIVTKAHQRATLIIRCFQSREPELLFKAFTVYVRPLLEYCSVIWSPHYVCDINKIESVQRRFTKRLNGLRDLPYSVRISKLNDDTLELRRLKLDLVMVYKVVHNLVNLNFEDLFHINRGRITRGHELRLLRENSKVLARSNNFCCRPLKIWNSLDASVAEAKSLYVFKSLLNTVNFEKCLLVRD